MTNPTNPYAKPKSSANPKKDPSRKAASKAKKDQRKKKEPTKGAPLKLDDLDLPKKADGSIDTDAMAERALNLGKADATVANRQAALRMFNMHAVLYGMTVFEKITKGEIAGDALVELFLQVASHFANHPTPVGYLDGFAAPNVDKAVKIMSASTLLKNFSCIMNSFREKFPGHEAFPTNPNDCPVWWKKLCKDFVNKFNYNKENKWNKDPNLFFGQNQARPIYSVSDRTETREVLAQKFMWQEDFVARNNHWENPEDGANLKSILGKAFSEASPERPGSYRKMMLDLDCFHRVCRGGEPRHNRWPECYWDQHHQALVTLKHMLKTLSEPLVSPLVMHEKHFVLCPLFVMGCYLFLDRGLIRTRQEMDDHLEPFMYPHERMSSSNETCRRIGNHLKGNLPKNATKELIDSISQKSLRKGSISEMAAHEQCTYWSLINRSGHSSGTNADSYLDRNSVQAGIVGAKILADHSFFHRPMKVPCPQYLATSDNKWRKPFEDLHAQALSGNCVSEFFPDGKLYCFSQILLCIMIMHYAEIVDTHGINFPWVIGMLDMAKRAEMKDIEVPEKSPHSILYEWSLKMKDQHQLNNDLMCVDGGGSGLSTCGKSSNHVRVLLQNNVDRSRMLEAKVDQLELALEQNRKKAEQNGKNLMNHMEVLFNQMGANFAELQKNIHHMSGQANLEEVNRLKRKVALLESPDPNIRMMSRGEDVNPCTPMNYKRRKTQAPDDDSPVIVLSKQQVEQEQEKAAANFGSKISNVGSMVQYQQNFENFSGNVQVSGDVCLVAPNPGNKAVMPRAALPHEYISVPKKMADEGKPVHLMLGKSRQQCHGTTGTIPIRILMESLRANGWFAGSRPFWHEERTVPGSCLGCKMNFRRAMELLQFVLLPEEEQHLKSKPGKLHPTPEDRQLYDDVVERMLRAMLELEGKNPDEEEENNKKRPGIKPTARVNILGKRVSYVKAKIRNVKNLPEKPGKNKYDDIAMLEIGVEEGPPGTPKGNTSILDHFGNRKQNSD